MPNTTDYEVNQKHRKSKKRWRRKNHLSLSKAKKKTLEKLYELGRLPKSLYSRIGL